MKHFSIIIPTLNEAQNIQPLMQRITNSFCASEYRPEVIFVDDGSTDGTRREVLDYTGELDVRLVCRDTERGLATAVLSGAMEASFDVVVVMDADLSHPPENIPQLVEPLLSGHFDMTVGSRYVKAGTTTGWPLSRKLCSLAASIPARLLTGIRDPLAGYFAVHRNALLTVDPGIRGYKIALEIIARGGEHLRVKEIPIHFTDRSAGSSKMSGHIIIEYLAQLFLLYGLRLSHSRIVPLIVSTLLGSIIDIAVFSLLTSLGYDLATSHIASYLLTMQLFFLGYIFYDKRFAQLPPRQKFYKKYLSFIIIVSMGVFLRGGFLALSETRSMFSPLSTTFTLAVSTILTITFYWLLATDIETPSSPKKNHRVFALAVIAYTVVLRLVFLGTSELIPEEAYYWNYAQHMSAGYLDHPPGVAMLIWLGTQLFGNNEFGVRIGAFGCWFITALFVHRLVRSIFDSTIALRAVLLAATLPVFFAVTLIITPDTLLIASWAGALYFLHEAFINNKTGAWIGAGICLGFGLVSKYTIVFMGPAIVVFMLIDPLSRRWFLKPQPYLTALLAFAIFSPVIWWNYHHEWTSFLFQSQDRLTALSEFSTHKLIASILILLTPTGFLAALASLKHERKYSGPRQHSPSISRSHLFCLTMALAPLSIFVLLSVTKEIKLNWTGPLWLSLLPFIAYSMVWPKGTLNQLIARSWHKTFIIVVLLYGGGLHYLSLGLPGVPFTADPFFFGWQELAAQIEDEVQNITKTQGQRPVVAATGKYQLPSGLAFYRYKNLAANDHNDYEEHVVEETTGSHIFGYNSLMYSYWHQPEDLLNKNILVISSDKRLLVPAYFQGRYHALGSVKQITATKHGKEAGTYYYLLLTGYTQGNQKDLPHR